MSNKPNTKRPRDNDSFDYNNSGETPANKRPARMCEGQVSNDDDLQRFRDERHAAQNPGKLCKFDWVYRRELDLNKKFMDIIDRAEGLSQLPADTVICVDYDCGRWDVYHDDNPKHAEIIREALETTALKLIKEEEWTQSTLEMDAVWDGKQVIINGDICSEACNLCVHDHHQWTMLDHHPYLLSV